MNNDQTLETIVYLIKKLMEMEAAWDRWEHKLEKLNQLKNQESTSKEDPPC